MENFEKKVDDQNTVDELQDLNKNVESTLPQIDNLPALGNDPDVKSATEKITSKCLEGALVNKLFLNQDVFKNKTISTYVDTVIKTNPELWFFMSANLGIDKFMDKKYEQLLPSQKIKLLALYDTLNSSVYQMVNPYKDAKGKIDVKKFEKAYSDHVKGIVDNLSIDFKLTQLSNLGDIKKTLKADYKLTEKEATKFVAYLEELKKQPNNVQEAGGYLYVLLAGVLLGALLGALGMKWYYDFTHPESQTVVQTGRVQIGDPRLIAKLLPVDADFKTAGSTKKEQFKVNEGDSWVKQQAKKLVNVAQNKEIVMELNGKFAVQFDLDNSTFEYDYTTKKIYAHLKKPKILITESNPKIIKKNAEVFEIKSFDNAEMELLDSLKQSVLLEASNQNLIYTKAKENAAEILNAIYSQAFMIGKVEFKGVEVIIDQPDDLPSNNNGSEPPNKPIQINSK